MEMTTPVVVNGAGPVGLTFAVALLDRATALGVPKPYIQIWDPNLTPWRETVIRLPYSLAAALPEQIQQELWEETASAPQRVFVPGPCRYSPPAENSRVHDPFSLPVGSYMATVQIKQLQEASMRYLVERYPQHCSLNRGKCPAEVMRGAAAVFQCYGKAARKLNPILGNIVAEEQPTTNLHAPSENGLFLLFHRSDVAVGERDSSYQQFNFRGNGFNTFQSHKVNNAVQVYIWPEDVTNDTGSARMPMSQEDLITNSKTFGLKALFDCVEHLQGEERWWWELSRRCRMQDANGTPVPAENMCTLEWRKGQHGWSQNCPQAGEKACSAAFEAWFDAVRYQISLNMYRMGIFGSHAEQFLHKVRLGYALRKPYRYSGVCTEVESVPVAYLGDAAGSTDFKKGLSCGRGLLVAAQLAFNIIGDVARQLQSTVIPNLKSSIQLGLHMYQRDWNSPEMIAEWRNDFDATFKYVLAGRTEILNACRSSFVLEELNKMTFSCQQQLITI